MLSYFISRVTNSIKVPVARRLLNKNLSRRKSNNVLRASGVTIPDGCTVMPPFFYEFGNIEISKDVFINAGCVFLDNEKIRIGDGSLIAPHVTLSTARHYIEPEHRNDPVISKSITIGKNVWIGAGAVVLQGVTIGDNSVIAANSVVKEDVPANVLVAGSPASVKKTI